MLHLCRFLSHPLRLERLARNKHSSLFKKPPKLEPALEEPFRIPYTKQESLTEREASVQLTSSVASLVKKVHNIFNIQSS